MHYGGVGHHIEALRDPLQIAPYMIANPVLYVPAVTLPKLAILGTFLRIFWEKPYRIACYVLAAVLVGNGIATSFAAAFGCTPIAYLWDKTIPGGHCIDYIALFRWGMLANILTDLVMLVLPLPVVWKLNTSKKVKVALTTTFLTGSM